MQPLHAQTCHNDITPTTPTQDFTRHDDGTVTHNKTGLIWMRCALGQNWNGATCTGSGQAYTWPAALQAAEGFSFAGHNDWRLPDIKELNSIVEQACMSPAINAMVFPAAPSTWFWSASPYAGYVRDAWSVSFGGGSDGAFLKTGSDRVRLVRGGQ
ncbi:Protein of unknown function [Nitrosomonas marina]|uniref:Lcl C-terminal domain-containing protein n=1 Tax=Nitrosomonas marina TaxID=917 RepID=A0A1H9YZU3_9PROT|nr:DUF1566 domain-containing protein [Nitrosomonas marina]SES74788.1 Protein of unknown function [Nitrosomonas marina]